MTPTNLKAARKDLGLTQAELAAILRMRGAHAPDTVRKWERVALGMEPI
jgi:DNA-binding transcriptional regulator YiaG